MSKDEFDERAVRVLSCRCIRGVSWDADYHVPSCPAYYRPVLAAEFRADAGEMQGHVDDVNRLLARLHEVEEYGREYIAKTDPLISCSPTGDPEDATCGECNDCFWLKIKALRVRLEQAEKELESFAETYPCHCAENYPGTTEYHGHDCQNEVVQEFVAQFVARDKP